MSNNLGSIYADLKNGERHIIIDAEKIELSGNVNLSIMDISQNLSTIDISASSINTNDASFVNLKFGAVSTQNLLPTGRGSSGQYLQTDGAGSLSWASIDGVNVTDSTANTNFPVVFHNESNGLLDDTGSFTYNPHLGKIVIPGAIEAAKDNNTASFFGAAAIGNAGANDQATFAHLDNNNTNNLALKQTAAGRTIINAKSGQNIQFRINNSDVARISSVGNLGIGLQNAAPSHMLEINNDISASSISTNDASFVNLKFGAVSTQNLLPTGHGSSGQYLQTDGAGSLSWGSVNAVNVTDSTANTNFPVVFHNESNGLLDDTGTYTYNPNSGTLVVPKIGAFEATGAINFGSQAMTNVNIDSGAIDGATIATSNITVGSGKTLNVASGTLTLANDQISGDKIEGGTIGSITITSLTAGGNTFPSGTGSNGQYLQTNGSGTLSWASASAGATTIVGTTALKSNHSGTNVNSTGSISLGYEAGNSGQGTYNVAIGYGAGKTSQGNYSVAIGNASGQLNGQGIASVAIGNIAGQNNQGDTAVAIGNSSGATNQGNLSIAIGNDAGTDNQDTRSVAIGYNAGKYDQGSYAVAIGDNAGTGNDGTGQGNYSVAIGTNAGAVNQSQYSVAIGNNAGQLNGQGLASVAIGNIAGQNNQGDTAIAIGNSSGTTNQGNLSIAIGSDAGTDNQDTRSIAIGYNAGKYDQGSKAVAIGDNAGTGNDGTGQGNDAVAIGNLAGSVNQGSTSVAIGIAAGSNSQGQYSVAIGNLAAQYNSQGQASVAVGNLAGHNNQGQLAVAVGNGASHLNQGEGSIGIGSDAGTENQGHSSVAIGRAAGKYEQGICAVAIGQSAGEGPDNVGQGDYAIGIGYQAGYQGQHDNSIVLNASGSALNSGGASRFHVKPIRDSGSESSNIKNLLYNTSTGEISHQALSGGGGTTVNGSSLKSNNTGTNVGTDSLSLGHQTGNSSQGQYSVAIGYNAGNTNQGDSCVAIGNGTAYENQGNQGIAIGVNAGYGSQGLRAIAIGLNAGNHQAGVNAIAIGRSSGQINQGTNSIAIGDNAAYTGQGADSIAFGRLAGHTNQHANSIVLNASGSNLNSDGTSRFYVKPIRDSGTESSNIKNLLYNTSTGEISHQALSGGGGYTTQIGGGIKSNHSNIDANNDSIVFGDNSKAGLTEISIGWNVAGGVNKSDIQYNIGIGWEVRRYPSSNNQTTTRSIYMGWRSGDHNQGDLNTCIGHASAGGEVRHNYANSTHYLANYCTGLGGKALTFPKSGGTSGATAVGAMTGAWHAKNYSTSIGYEAGYNSVGEYSVAIGFQPNYGSNADKTVAIGYRAGRTSQKTYAVAIGSDAAYDNQGTYTVAIGNEAGKQSQGSMAVAIGYQAGHTNQHHYSLVLNASGSALNTDGAERFFVKPIRDSGTESSNIKNLVYNTSTGEISHQALSSGGGGGSTFDTLTNAAGTGAKIHLHAGSTNGQQGTWRAEFCHIIGQKSNAGTGTIGFYHDEMAGLNHAGSSMQGFYINFGGPAVWISGQTNSSDDRIKHNEETITNGLETIRQLVPEKYLKGKSIDDEYAFTEAGFIAQKVLDISNLNFTVTQSNKELIEGDPSSCCYGLNYSSIFTYNVAATKELDVIVTDLSNNLLVANNKITQLETELANLRQENTIIKNALNSLLPSNGQI
jgi:hypothetical protein